MRKRLRKKKDKQGINPIDAMLDIVIRVADKQNIEVDIDSFNEAKKDIKVIIMKGCSIPFTHVDVA